MDWRHKAVCRDEDPELFFPVGNSGPALAQIADAKLVCNRCPVTTECLSWALNTGQDTGVSTLSGNRTTAARTGGRIPSRSRATLRGTRRRGVALRGPRSRAG